jgi:hypothetical protein
MLNDCQKYALAVNTPPIEDAALTVGSQTGKVQQLQIQHYQML